MFKSIERASNFFAVIFFSASYFLLTRQFPFPDLIPFATIFLMVSICFAVAANYFTVKRGIPRSELILLLIFWLVVFFSFIYSTALNTDPSHRFRFFVILLALGIVSITKYRTSIVWIFLFLTSLQAFLVISVCLHSLFFYEVTSFLDLRNIFQDPVYLGDHYFKFFGLPVLQIKGNSLMPLAYFISFYFLFNKHLIPSRIFRKVWILVVLVFALGNLFCGNFAFWVACTMFSFALFLTLRSTAKKTLTIVFCGILFLPIFSLFLDIFIEKGVSSNPIKFEQVGLILNSFWTDRTSVFGAGLGAELGIDGTWRDYGLVTYIEMQSFLIFYMVGPVIFCALSVLHFFQIRTKIGRCKCKFSTISIIR